MERGQVLRDVVYLRCKERYVIHSATWPLHETTEKGKLFM